MYHISPAHLGWAYSHTVTLVVLPTPLVAFLEPCTPLKILCLLERDPVLLAHCDTLRRTFPWFSVLVITFFLEVYKNKSLWTERGRRRDE